MYVCMYVCNWLNVDHQMELLEMVTSGIVAFFTAQPAMLEQVPQLGHVPKLFKAMSSRNDSIPKTALQIVQQLSNSEVRKLTIDSLMPAYAM